MRRLICHVFLGLLLLLRLSSVAHAGAASKSADPGDAETAHSLEQLALASYLKNLLVWDEKDSNWQVARGADAPNERASVVIVHLWADWCKPCREEFPILRDLAEQVEGAHSGKVQFLYLSQTQGQAEMQSFLFKYRARMPKASIYQSTALGEFLLRQLSRTGLPLPVTLILDERRIVRSAIIGSVAQHRSYIATTVARIVSSSPGSGQP